LLVPRRPATEPSESSAASVLRLKIRLLEVSPMIWRRVLVPASYTLEELHGVIQVAMGWQSLHLYQFFIRAVHYGSFDLCVSSPDRTLTSFRFRKGAKFIYEYDMGDFWRHEVRIEDQLEPNSEQPYPVCTGGAHSCPPEDCGGPEGYDERRREAIGFDAMNDFATVAELTEEALLSGKQDLLKDPDALWSLQQAVDRMKARQPFLRDGFSKREVNARFRRAEHHVLMHQQF
jgi:Plasmid pRiA4b ORF-3-like protein